MHTPGERAEQIEEYKKELRLLTTFYRFDLYCEEIKQSAFSHAERYAINRRKRSVNIDMPKDVRLKLGIPCYYANPRNSHGYAEHQILQWHTIREEYMYERATDRMNQTTVALVICGEAHRERLVERFNELGGKVVAEDFRQKPWYRPELYMTDYYI